MWRYTHRLTDKHTGLIEEHTVSYCNPNLFPMCPTVASLWTIRLSSYIRQLIDEHTDLNEEHTVSYNNPNLFPVRPTMASLQTIWLSLKWHRHHRPPHRCCPPTHSRPCIKSCPRRPELRHHHLKPCGRPSAGVLRAVPASTLHDVDAPACPAPAPIGAIPSLRPHAAPVSGLTPVPSHALPATLAGLRRMPSSTTLTTTEVIFYYFCKLYFEFE
jgi:hypothetical protein